MKFNIFAEKKKHKKIYKFYFSFNQRCPIHIFFFLKWKTKFNQTNILVQITSKFMKRSKYPFGKVDNLLARGTTLLVRGSRCGVVRQTEWLLLGAQARRVLHLSVLKDIRNVLFIKYSSMTPALTSALSALHGIQSLLNLSKNAMQL